MGFHFNATDASCKGAPRPQRRLPIPHSFSLTPFGLMINRTSLRWDGPLLHEEAEIYATIAPFEPITSTNGSGFAK